MGTYRWIIVLFTIVLSACSNSPCRKSKYNEVLSSETYNSKAYQEELYQLIKTDPEVTFYYETKEEIMGQEFLVVNAYGDAFCGKLCLLIPQEDQIRNTLKSTRKNTGAQLVGLRFQRKETGYGPVTVLQSVEYIVD
ncbi:hypothetical protein [Croceiramulus getboli]|nr:hypothetical protein P8624_03230 [Flavobacteriaceae bacterium YJPT1-3]